MRSKFQTFAAVILIAAAASGVFGQARFSTYANDRFAFSIDHPVELKMQPAPANNDGRTFLSADGRTELRVWAGFNAADVTAAEKLREDIDSSGITVTYQTTLKNGYVFSGTAGDVIYYQKTLHRKTGDADVFYTFTFKYPRAQRKRFDAMVKRIADSFKFDPNADV